MTSSHSGTHASTMHVALLFPSSESFIPTADMFAGEKIDFVLFPEGYDHSSQPDVVDDDDALADLAEELGVTLLVGATIDTEEGVRQTLYRFNPDGSDPDLLYTKHSSAEIVAFNFEGWNPRDDLPTFDLGGVKTGATICHDCYLGPLQQHMARDGARLWLNPNGEDVVDAKWAPVLRLRAVENGFFALSTHHHDMYHPSGRKKRKTHPYAFSPCGGELRARKAGSSTMRPISNCTESDSVYIVELDIPSVSKPFNWSEIPRATQSNPNKNPKKPLRISLRNGQPAVYTKNSWHACDNDGRIETEYGGVYVGFVRDKRVLNAAACFEVIDNADKKGCRPIIWNHWDSLPVAESDRVGNLLKGRAIECCAPIVVSDSTGIRELVELANTRKLPVRRPVQLSEAVVEMKYAFGLSSAFKMVSENIDSQYREDTLDNYRGLCHGLSDDLGTAQK